MISPTLANLFGRSPIKPIEKHMAKVHEAVLCLSPLIQASLDRDFNKIEELYNDICRVEREADLMKTKIRQHLPKSLFLPAPRTDFLDLLTIQDTLANSAKDIAGTMLGRQMVIPEGLKVNFVTLVDAGIATSSKAVEIVAELDNLLETGFGGHQVEIIDEMMKSLSDCENAADDAEILVRRNLFALEAELPPVDTMFLYEIIRWVSGIADKAQRVGHRLQLLTAH